MQCLVLSHICSTPITGERNPSMWMSKLELARGLRDDSEMVSVNIERPWHFGIVLATLDATVCTYFCFALQTTKLRLVSTQTTWTVHHTPMSSACVDLAHVHQTGPNHLAKQGEVRINRLPSRGRSPRDGRWLLLTSPSFSRGLIRL